MARILPRVGSRARPPRKQSNGVVALGVCVLLGLVAVAGAVVLSTKNASEAETTRNADEAKAAKVTAQGQQEHAKLVKSAVDQMSFHSATIGQATVTISNLWRDWLSRGGDVDKAVDRALESLNADGTTARVKSAADLVRDHVQKAIKAGHRDPELHAKLVTLSGLYQELVNAAVNPSGSHITYTDSLGRLDSDIKRSAGELRTLLAARGL